MWRRRHGAGAVRRAGFRLGGHQLEERRAAVAAVLAISAGLGVVANASTATVHGGAGGLATNLAAPRAQPRESGSREAALVPGTPGVNFGGGEVAVWRSTYAQQLATFAQVKASGAQWARWTVPMDDQEPRPGRFNWYAAQELRAAVASGLKVDALLTNSPSWAATADGSPSPTAFAAFAKAAVQEYWPLGVTTYEIWNEENDTQAWGKAFTPAEYAALLRATYAAIKGAHPGATVVVGGFAPAPDATDGTSYEPVTFLTGMYADGAQGSFDAIADHPYSFPDRPDQSDAWNPFTYLPTLHHVMAAHGDGGKQIWLTEYGAPTSGTSGAMTPQFKAESITEAFRWAHNRSWVGPLFIFDWQPSPYDTDGDYAIHNAGGALTLGGLAFSGAASGYSG